MSTREWEPNCNGCPVARLALDGHPAAVPLGKRKHHRQAKAASVGAFCCKIGFETLSPNLFGHPFSGIRYLDDDIVTFDPRSQYDDAPARERIHRVEDEVSQGLAEIRVLCQK